MRFSLWLCQSGTNAIASISISAPRSNPATCTAALAGTLAANAFYLTMQMYYFYAFVALALAIPAVFAPGAERVRVAARAEPPPALQPVQA